MLTNLRERPDPQLKAELIDHKSHSSPITKCFQQKPVTYSNQPPGTIFCEPRYSA
ncbi:hypothetical protein DSO57_1037883 [Entomophthora muscae]|uniref:Uncharacterized protein n=1 Tax=Entomophthora muscae TaxID=34485 RepID=A0ACC2SBV6_9FUNG|nr:hypothetical protein DSO57_1037883 [Entomophthora muscae]